MFNQIWALGRSDICNFYVSFFKVNPAASVRELFVHVLFPDVWQKDMIITSPVSVLAFVIDMFHCHGHFDVFMTIEPVFFMHLGDIIKKKMYGLGNMSVYMSVCLSLCLFVYVSVLSAPKKFD